MDYALNTTLGSRRDSIKKGGTHEAAALSTITSSLKWLSDTKGKKWLADNFESFFKEMASRSTGNLDIPEPSLGDKFMQILDAFAAESTSENLREKVEDVLNKITKMPAPFDENLSRLEKSFTDIEKTLAGEDEDYKARQQVQDAEARAEMEKERSKQLQEQRTILPELTREAQPSRQPTIIGDPLPNTRFLSAHGAGGAGRREYWTSASGFQPQLPPLPGPVTRGGVMPTRSTPQVGQPVDAGAMFGLK